MSVSAFIRMIPILAVYRTFLESVFDCYSTSAYLDQSVHWRGLICIYTGRKCGKVGFLYQGLYYFICNKYEFGKLSHPCNCMPINHYDNTPLHFNAIFHGSMNRISETKIYSIFFIYGPNRLWVLVRTASARRF